MRLNYSIKYINSEKKLSKNVENLDQLANCIRFLSIDAVQKANSGHPGMPMGMADIATVLFKDFLKFDPSDPGWLDRDRFIVSNGHGSMLLYSCLYLSGYKGINIENIKNFRQLGSPTAGHPEYWEIPGIETTTGPLSQGLANGVGMALAEKILSSKFGNEIFNHNTYVFAGDGCLMEGLSHEACSLAGHLKLSKLIVFFDDNSISIDGPTNLSVSDNNLKRFDSYGWNTIAINGHNQNEIQNAILEAKKSSAPTIIACKTKIGYGSPNKESSSKSHGSPLGNEEVELTRKNLNWPHEPFFIPNNLIDTWRNFHKRNIDKISKWKIKFDKIVNTDEFKNYFNQDVKNELKENINSFKKKHIEEKTNCATRKASEIALETLQKNLKNLLGGSADLTGSNNTLTKLMKPISKDDFSGSYLYYGVREHAMAGIMNGIALHGGIIPYGGTFLVFTDYCRPSIRLAALMGLQVIYVMTHDSIGLGEDGPTHQPIEHLASLRAIPNLNVIRPCDVIETIEAWENAIKSKNNPTILVLTRQNVPLLREKNNNENLVEKGAYVILDCDHYDGTILATGSEVEIAIKSAKLLLEENINIRVVSFPSWNNFENQALSYQKSLLGNKPIFAIEAGIINGWEKYVSADNFLGMKSFGASGTYKDLYKHFEITDKKLVEIIKENI